MKNRIHELKNFYILWSTQGLSQLGSAMTNFALTLWLYQETGSALKTALLSICSYAPYVLVSIFAGALSDKWDKKKTMLVCDLIAACCTVLVFILLKTGMLCAWHLFVLNAVNGLMNTVQRPASDVANTLITPKKYYQKTSGLRSFSGSLITILHPMLATSLYALGGMDVVIAVDLSTFLVAFFALWLFVQIPPVEVSVAAEKETLIESAKAGLKCLNRNRMVLMLILFLAGVNFVASAFDAVLPAFILPRENGGEAVLGVVTSFVGIAMLAGSLIVSVLPPPKDRIRLIVVTMLFSLTTDNFLMPLTRTPITWCIAQILGYFPVPLMSASLDVIVRTTIPAEMQGRVYSCRNTLQFFTIPIGFFFGGWMVDAVCEPLMERVSAESIMVTMFGQGKGSGAGMMIFILGLLGMAICLIFGRILRKYKYHESV
ncbi:MAG: MFS transporter [Clostridiaceae bacterium]|nr:MFS transporter [Clostridiaceae bacterium]